VVTAKVFQSEMTEASAAALSVAAALVGDNAAKTSRADKYRTPRRNQVWRRLSEVNFRFAVEGMAGLRLYGSGL
jgi:hypothetical protein